MIKTFICFAILLVAHVADVECRYGCDPYSIEKCKDTAKALGKGFTSKSYRVKGCYGYTSGTYATSLYYGTGGTEEQMKAAPDYSNQFRPIGDDCLINGCVPYSIEACKVAAKALGKALGGGGYVFDSSSHGVKGCYGYKTGNYAKYMYYGTEGTEEQMQAALDSTNQFRPIGYDCQTDECESCYGAESVSKPCCYTCNEVIAAYNAKGWKYDQNNFQQCS